MNGIKNKIEVESSFVKEMVLTYQSKGKSLFISSSFQTHSIPMLHLLSTIDNKLPIYFIDTGFHFPETLIYRDQLTKLLGLNLKIARSQVSKIDLIGPDNKFLFTTDPDKCCDINKVSPMNEISNDYDVWITGIRKDQSANRSSFDYEAEGQNGIIRFHPMINWDDKMINTYIFMHNLPAHPLGAFGYESIGCSPCTNKPAYDERSGRWVGMQKTECGLHLIK